LVTTLAGFLGVILGGGSFLVFPLLFLLGVDPKIAVATNIAAAVGHIGSGAFVFYKKKKFDVKVIKQFIPFVLLGAALGIFILIELKATWIKFMVTFAIIIFALLNLWPKKKELNARKLFPKTYPWAIPPTGVLLGIYQTTISAGAGILLTFLLTHLSGLSLRKAIMNRPFINLPVFVLSIIVFAFKGMIHWALFLPMFLGRTLGAYLGAHLVVQMNHKILSLAFNFTVIVLASYTLWTVYMDPLLKNL